MRAATIDIGTNTVLLLVSERAESGELVAVAVRATITRLGQGVDRTRALAPEAIERTCACLDAYASAIRELGAAKIAVVGTSAMRDASGGEAIQGHVRRVLGVEARVISGEQEARLTFAGALSGLRLDPPGSAVTVFDIGGGSTEVVRGVAGKTELAYARSFDVGSVRLTERRVRTDPPSRAERDQILADARAAFASVPKSERESTPIGIAGTMTTLAAVSLKMQTYDGSRVHGMTMPLSELARTVNELGALTLAERRLVPGLEPKRADVIVAGGLVALAFLEHVGATAVRISDRGVRWGLAEELLPRERR